MKISVERDDGTTEVFTNVTDAYLALRQDEPFYSSVTDGVVLTSQTRSYSWGANVRELVKELQQSLVELQDFLRSHRNGGSS